MTIHSAADHGFTHDSAVRVHANDEYMHHSAEGTWPMRVLGRHRDRGYWECVWLAGPRERGIWVRAELDILDDLTRV